MPGAQNNAYNDAIQQFYQALQTGASFAGGLGGATPGGTPSAPSDSTAGYSYYNGGPSGSTELPSGNPYG